MRVIAAPGLQVPMEHNPRQYITDAKAVTVEASAYYIRTVAFGDLIEQIDDSPAIEPESDKKVAKKGAE